MPSAREERVNSIMLLALGFVTCGFFWLLNYKMYGSSPKADKRAKRLARLSCGLCFICPFIVIVVVLIVGSAYLFIWRKVGGV